MPVAECLHSPRQLRHALVGDDTSDEDKHEVVVGESQLPAHCLPVFRHVVIGDGVRTNMQVVGNGLTARQMSCVLAVDVPVVYDLQRLAGDMVGLEGVQNALSLGNDIGGKRAGYPFHGLQNGSQQSVGTLVAQSRHEVHPPRHACCPSSNH